MNFTQNLSAKLTALFLLFTPFMGIAQGDEAIQAELTEFLHSFVEDYVNLPESQNPDAVLQYFAQDAQSNFFFLGITGKSTVKNSNRDQFANYLNNIVQSGGINLNYEIGDIHFTYISPELATLVYPVDYETKEADGIWVKGKETVTLALEKQRDKWQIVHYSILQIEEEKLKGTCLCELFLSQGEDGEVVAKTTIPTGSSYSTKFNNFEFKKSGQSQIIKTDEKVYRHTKTGELMVLAEDGERFIGNTSSRRETVLTILEEHLYKNSCASLKTKVKK